MMSERCILQGLEPGGVYGHLSHLVILALFLKLLSPICKKRLKILKNMFYKSVLE